VLLWPFPDSSGVYHGAPLWIVAPVLLAVLGVAVLIVVLVSKPKNKEHR